MSTILLEWILLTFALHIFGVGGMSSTPNTNYFVYPNSSSSSNDFIYPIPSNRYKSYHFTLTEGSCQPDNFVQSCYLINGEFPGPPIFVNQYDFLEVRVVNRLQTPTAIHFHGILQTHTLDADGVAYVTQDPILPNQTYVYRMQIEGQTGSYMYHGHFSLDLVWLHGPLIIRDNPAFWKALGDPYHFDPGHEHVFQLEAVYHQPVETLAKNVLQNGFAGFPIVSLPINGLSYGNWSKNDTGTAPGYEVIKVTPGKTYRFRIINISTGSYFRFQIEQHNLTVIEADGILIDPVETTHLEINTGQRYSVLVRMNKNPKNYWISSEVMGGNGPRNGKAILHYRGTSEDVEPLRKQLFVGTTPGQQPTLEGWILKDLKPNLNYIENQVPPFPEKANHTILIDMQFKTRDGQPRFLINGHPFVEPNSTYLTRVRQGEDISLGDPHVFKIVEGDVVDMIFQNRVDDGGRCGPHPIHLHGHLFWVLLSGENSVDMETLPGDLEVASKHGHVYRDVFTLFPSQSPENRTSGAGCGWSVIRFPADNPGLWLVHCHITAHMMLGKLFTLYEVNPENPMLINE